ncbi:LegC2/C7 family Dot/Icm T4SS effector [Fluoribacter gormanii]|uniref:LegC2/C7 family Dot/Icm T4SS effector n=1 Tax=Fluoribacter gormanii TaxID=464 RepID=UPI00104110EE|nr:LegC2/C7 family Dot/Icm T4SS effector [Fluoribacter gormanii]
MATNAEELQHLIEIDISEQKPTESSQKIREEEIHSQLKILKEDTEQDKLEKITITKEIFEEIRKSLQDTVKSMEKNPSIFSRAAEYWGELPLWQKIIGGVALTVPTLIIGIAAHIGFLLALCGVTAVTYAAGGVILDDHHKCSTSAVESLQKGILGLADLLELTINALDIIRKQLATEIQKFVKENEKLAENIEALSNQIDAIDKQVIATSKVNTILGETKDGLVAVSESLKEGVTQQADLMKQNQEKLDRITEAYSANQKELALKVLEVQKVRFELGEELTKARSLIEALHSSVSQLSLVAIGDEEKRLAFQKKLDEFIENKEASFLQIADRICASEEKLKLVQLELENTNRRYHELLQIQEKHIDTLKILSTQSPSEQTPKTTPVGEILSNVGIYATRQGAPVSQATQTLSPEFN